jgi:hypothetical protein
MLIDGEKYTIEGVFLYIFTGDQIKLILLTNIKFLCPKMIGLDRHRWWKSS